MFDIHVWSQIKNHMKCKMQTVNKWTWFSSLCCSCPSLILYIPPSANLNTVKCVFEEKLCQITSESFYSEEQVVKFHTLRLQWVAITACIPRSNAQRFMHVLQIRLWNTQTCVYLWIPVKASCRDCLLLCADMAACCWTTATWTSELFNIFPWRYQREPKNKTIYTTDTHIPSPLCILTSSWVTRKLYTLYMYIILFFPSNIKHFTPWGFLFW